MNPRQRRGLIFLVVAVIGAVAVFFSIISYVDDVESQVGERVDAWVVNEEIQPYSTIDESMLERVKIPKRWIPDGAVQDLTLLTGQVAAATLTKGTLLQQSSLIPSPTLQAGQREIALLISADSGVAGKIGPGDHVDVWATYDANATAQGGAQAGALAKVIAQDLLVIDVGVQTSTQQVSTTGGLKESEVVPVTFAAAESQVRALYYAKGVALQINLALRPPGDSSQIAPENRTYQETFGSEG